MFWTLALDTVSADATRGAREARCLAGDPIDHKQRRSLRCAKRQGIASLRRGVGCSDGTEALDKDDIHALVHSAIWYRVHAFRVPQLDDALPTFRTERQCRPKQRPDRGALLSVSSTFSVAKPSLALPFLRLAGDGDLDIQIRRRARIQVVVIVRITQIKSPVQLQP